MLGGMMATVHSKTLEVKFYIGFFKNVFKNNNS